VPELDRLATYRSRRDPSITPEPDGSAPRAGNKGAIFVVQEHHASSLHWDLRLEHEGVLVSWAVPKGLPRAPGVERLAVHTEDHPLSYAQFEGTIPAGEYGGGWVRVTDSGPVEITRWTAGTIEFTLQGSVLAGRHILHRNRGDNSEHWTLRRRDPPTDPDYEPVPAELSPMLAVTGKPATAAGWTFEVKWDGYRALAQVIGGRVRLSSRSGKDITTSAPGLAGLGAALADHEVLLGRRVGGSGAGRTPRLRPAAAAHGDQGQQPRTIAGQRGVIGHLPDLRPAAPGRTIHHRFAARRAPSAAGGVGAERASLVGATPAGGHDG